MDTPKDSDKPNKETGKIIKLKPKSGKAPEEQLWILVNPVIRMEMRERLHKAGVLDNEGSYVDLLGLIVGLIDAQRNRSVFSTIFKILGGVALGLILAILLLSLHG